MEFIESGLKFTFDAAQWQVIHFDKNANYKNLADVVKATKAIDFLCIYQNETLVLFEVKSFRQHRIENKQRLEAGAEELTAEIAQKTRDSLAAMIGARRNSTHDEGFWETVSQLLIHPKKQLLIIAWIEKDGSTAHRQKMEKQRTSVELGKLKNKLKWLSGRVFIENVKSYDLDFKGFSCQFPAGN